MVDWRRKRPLTWHWSTRWRPSRLRITSSTWWEPWWWIGNRPSLASPRWPCRPMKLRHPRQGGECFVQDLQGQPQFWLHVLSGILSAKKRWWSRRSWRRCLRCSWKTSWTLESWEWIGKYWRTRSKCRACKQVWWKELRGWVCSAWVPSHPPWSVGSNGPFSMRSHWRIRGLCRWRSSWRRSIGGPYCSCLNVPRHEMVWRWYGPGFLHRPFPGEAIQDARGSSHGHSGSGTVPQRVHQPPPHGKKRPGILHDGPDIHDSVSSVVHTFWTYAKIPTDSVPWQVPRVWVPTRQSKA